MKFIHAADLHLDNPFVGLSKMSPNLFEKLKEATFIAFTQMIDDAITMQVDAVLIAGDVFDAEKQSVKAQLIFQDGMHRLDKAGIYTFISHGNHDYIGEARKAVHYGEKIKVLPNEIASFQFTTHEGEKVAVSGFSYDKRWVEKDCLAYYPKKNPEVDFHIGMLHGEQYQKSGDNHYAPFTLDDIKRTGYDYMALGHIHKRQKILDDPLTYYSGSMQGLNRKETGEKGYTLVELAKGTHAKVSFQSVAPIVWVNMRLPLTDMKQLDDLSIKIDEIVNSFIEKDYDILLSLSLIQANDNSNDLLEEIEINDLLLSLQERYQDSSVFIYRIKTNYIDKTALTDLAKQFPDYFQTSLEKLFDTAYFNQLTDDLFANKKAVREIQTRDKVYRKQLQADIQNMGGGKKSAHDY